jgi:hypothetical protein
MKSSALGRARAAATCADDGPLSLGLLSTSRGSAWPAMQRAARVRDSQRAGCETASATMLAVVFGEASRSGLRFSSPSPLPGGSFSR